ncbi:MAG: GNAT family N-acetyltransferase [Armatimonadota bacterium]
MLIRTYTPHDLPHIQRITVESFEGVSIDRNIERDFGLVAGRDWRERKARDVTTDCEVQPEGVFVAEVDEAVAGYITTRIDRFTGIGRIPNLAVAPEYRAQGIGSRLIEHALEWMREQGLALAKIETLEQNERGQALYPRFGFREVARQIHYVMRLQDGDGE